MIDPGAEATRIELALDAAAVRCVAILLTHGHIDHVGAVAALARRRRSPVYISSGDAPMLAREDVWPGFDDYEPYDAEVKLDGDERFDVAGLEIRTHQAPGHTPHGVVFEVAAPDGDRALFVGDTIFRGSVGRSDFPESDPAALAGTLARLYDGSLPLDVPVYSGHTEPTTLRAELRSNPFLDHVRSARR